MSRWKCFVVRPSPASDPADPVMWTGVRDGETITRTWDQMPPGAVAAFAADDPSRDTVAHGKRYIGEDGYEVFVRLPGRVWWNIGAPSTGGGPGWTRSGAVPEITAHPSIHYVWTYHGYVRNGYVTDDVDGRQFNDEGRQQ